MLDSALASARAIIDQRVEAVEAIAQHLLAHEYASGEQISAIMAKAVGKKPHQKVRAVSA
jgi:ATP-dependent Zn protease